LAAGLSDAEVAETVTQPIRVVAHPGEYPDGLRTFHGRDAMVGLDDHDEVIFCIRVPIQSDED